MKKNWAGGALVIALLAGGVAGAMPPSQKQSPTKAPTSTPGERQRVAPSQGTDDALRGPTTAPGAAELPAIFERDAEGAPLPLEVTPEEAAVSKLTLDAETRKRVDDVLAARRAAVDKAVRENIPILLKIRTEAAAGNRMGVSQAVLELLDRAPELREGRRAGQDVLAALPPEQAAQARRMIQHHRTAVFHHMRGAAARTGVQVEELIRAELLHGFGAELRRSLERQAAFAEARLEEALAAVGATPEQDRQIRKLVIEFIERSLGNPREEQRRELFGKIAATLSPEQVEKLIRFSFGVEDEAAAGS